MSVESDLYTLLSGNAGITALVSTRIYPDVLPEECAYPAIAFSRARTEPLVGVSGQVFGADVDVSVGCWAETRTAADAVADAVETACAGGAFSRAGREAAVDPETGLFAAVVSLTTFAAG